MGFGEGLAEPRDEYRDAASAKERRIYQLTIPAELSIPLKRSSILCAHADVVNGVRVRDLAMRRLPKIAGTQMSAVQRCRFARNSASTGHRIRRTTPILNWSPQLG